MANIIELISQGRKEDKNCLFDMVIIILDYG